MDSNVWLPIATLVGGAALGFVGEWLRDRREYAREQERDRREWRRQVTLDLMNALGDLLQVVTDARDAKRQRFERTGVWDLAEDDRRILQVVHPVDTRCVALAHLVADIDLGIQAMKVVNGLVTAALLEDKEAADSAMLDAAALRTETIAQLGVYAQSL